MWWPVQFSGHNTVPPRAQPVGEEVPGLAEAPEPAQDGGGGGRDQAHSEHKLWGVNIITMD